MGSSHCLRPSSAKVVRWMADSGRCRKNIGIDSVIIRRRMTFCEALEFLREGEGINELVGDCIKAR